MAGTRPAMTVERPVMTVERPVMTVEGLVLTMGGQVLTVERTVLTVERAPGRSPHCHGRPCAYRVHTSRKRPIPDTRARRVGGRPRHLVTAGEGPPPTPCDGSPGCGPQNSWQR